MLERLKNYYYLKKVLIRARLFLFKALYIRVGFKYSRNKSFKKIIHVNTEDIIGGAARVAYDLFSSQLKFGLEAFMLVRTKISNHPNISIADPVFSKKQTNFFYAQKHLGGQDFFNLSIFELIKTKYFKNTDIIHLHNLHGGYFSPLVLPALSNKYRVVWTLHDMHSFTGHCAHSFDCERWQIGCGNCPDLTLYPAIDKDSTEFIWKTKQKIYKKSKIDIVAVSNWLVHKIEKSILSNQKLHVIHNGIDVQVFKPMSKSALREKYGIPANKKVILFSANAGLSNPYKGGKFVLKIIEDHPGNDLLFINIGSSAESRVGNVWQIQFVNNQNELAEWYSLSDLFLYPSLADNCPLVVLESMACGCPVLSFQTGGIPELVNHNENGYLAKYKDYEDLKNGFNQLLSNSDLLNKMSENSVKRVQDNFTLSVMSNKYLNLYKEISSRD